MYQNSVASAVYCNIIQIASAGQVPAFSGATHIFLLLCSAHECSALLSNAHYWQHFLTLQPPRFASGFKTRWWWAISLPLAQHVTWKPPHTLHFLHGTHLGTSSSMRRASEEAQLQVLSAAHPGFSTPSQGKAAQHPGAPPNAASQASSCWKIQWKRAWEREKDARHHFSSRDGVMV